jgi:hypothetical protein
MTPRGWRCGRCVVDDDLRAEVAALRAEVEALRAEVTVLSDGAAHQPTGALVCGTRTEGFCVLPARHDGEHCEMHSPEVLRCGVSDGDGPWACLRRRGHEGEHMAHTGVVREWMGWRSQDRAWRWERCAVPECVLWMGHPPQCVKEDP